MKRAIWLVLLAAVLAGCEDFPIEGGDDFAAGAHHAAQGERQAGAVSSR